MTKGCREIERQCPPSPDCPERLRHSTVFCHEKGTTDLSRISKDVHDCFQPARTETRNTTLTELNRDPGVEVVICSLQTRSGWPIYSFGHLTLLLPALAGDGERNAKHPEVEENLLLTRSSSVLPVEISIYILSGRLSFAWYFSRFSEAVAAVTPEAQLVQN